MQPIVILQFMVLLTAANGTPVIAKRMLGDVLAYPLDAGASFIDGRPLLGPSKTIRGIVVSVLATSAVAPLIGLGWRIGVAVGIMAMAGDLFSSFLKRRMNFPSSSKAIGLDQIPESLFPLLGCRSMLALTSLDIFVAVLTFLIGELIISRLLFSLHIRDRPF